MKRTTNMYGTKQPDDRDGISGLRQFDGEDLRIIFISIRRENSQIANADEGLGRSAEKGKGY